MFVGLVAYGFTLWPSQVIGGGGTPLPSPWGVRCRCKRRMRCCTNSITRSRTVKTVFSLCLRKKFVSPCAALKTDSFFANSLARAYKGHELRSNMLRTSVGSLVSQTAPARLRKLLYLSRLLVSSTRHLIRRYSLLTLKGKARAVVIFWRGHHRIFILPQPGASGISRIGSEHSNRAWCVMEWL